MKAQQGDTVEINRNKNHQITFIRFKPNANRKLADGAAFLSKILKMGYFLRMAILANIIALPVSYWLMKEWLTRFAYKTELSGLIFFEVAGILFLLVIISSGYSAWRAGTMNPVDVIKIQ